jgi:hypothetical protein
MLGGVRNGVIVVFYVVPMVWLSPETAFRVTKRWVDWRRMVQGATRVPLRPFPFSSYLQ